VNKLYVFVPLILLVAFGGVYVMHSKDSAAKAVAAAAETERAAAVEAAKKAEAERQAREDAERRSAERLAEEKRKEDERAARWEAASQQIADDTAGFLAQAERHFAEVRALEARLAALRSERDRASQAAFDLAKEVEAARIAKRNAELEIQRLVEMTARRAGTTLAGTSP
jgi:hypothetical protein